MPYPLLIKHILERPVKLHPKKEAIVCRNPSRAELGLPVDFRYTYGEFYKRVCQVANMLEGLGVKRGDAVAIYSHDCHRYAEVVLATPCIGAVTMPLTRRLPMELYISMLNRAGSKVLFIDEESIPLFEGIKDELKTVDTYIIMTDKKELPQTKLPNVYSYEELMGKASPEYAFSEDLDENSPAAIFHSGGVTGIPKLMPHSQRSIFLSSVDACVVDTIGLSSGDVYIPGVGLEIAFPACLPYAAILLGAKMVLTPDYMNSKELGELIEQERASWLAGYSPQVVAWAAAWEKEGWKYDLSSLKRVLTVGLTRVPVEPLRNFAEKTGAFVFPYTGSAEAAAMYMASIPKKGDRAEQEKLLRVDGIPSPLNKWKVVRTKGGEEIKHDGKERGLWAMKGPHVIEEYYKDPETTAEKFDDEGYFYSGDTATIDEEGFVRLWERIEDLIRGEEGFIYPSELEEVLGEHPAAKDIAAIGVPHGEFERPLVCVTLKEEYKGKVSEQELRKKFEGKVPEWQTPEVVIIEEMPLVARYKYDKGALKKRFVDYYK